MRKKHATAAAMMAAAVVGVLSWLLPRSDAGVGDAAGSDAPVAEPADASASVEDEWPGKEEGYVGPNGEGAVDPSDYESDEDYEAVINPTD